MIVASEKTTMQCLSLMIRWHTANVTGFLRADWHLCTCNVAHEYMLLGIWKSKGKHGADADAVCLRMACRLEGKAELANAFAFPTSGI